jgi:hypothetical protein
MTAAALVAALRAYGVELMPAGNRLRFRPASKVPPELLETLRQRKAEVLELLGSQPDGAGMSYAHPWPDSLVGLGVRHIGSYDECACCTRWSWARYGPMVLCLDCARQRTAVREP